ncbi:MAG: tetratricopeptide repeat protein [Firmicutes bacterium]|nr:tetratricopeptide repeat protein [Bacillota bacterium]
MRRYILLFLAGILAVALCLSPASGADRELPEVHFTNGLVYYALGFTEMATKELQRVCELEPTNNEARMALGLAYQAKGDLNSALKAYEEVLRIDSSLLHVHGLMGDIYRAKGDSKKARAHYLEASKDPELLAIPYYGLGVLAEEAGETTEAMANYREVLAAAPEHTDAALRLVLLLRETDAIDDALQVVTEANRYNPRNAELHYQWGLLYLEKEEYDKAHHEFDRVLQLEEGHPGARKQLQDLQKRSKEN